MCSYNQQDVITQIINKPRTYTIDTRSSIHYFDINETSITLGVVQSFSDSDSDSVYFQLYIFLQYVTVTIIKLKYNMMYNCGYELRYMYL